MVGRAYPVVCDVDFLDVLKALSEAGEGEASRDGGHRRGRPRPRRRHDRGDGCSGLRAGGDAPSRDHPGDRGAVRAACVGGVVAGRRDLLFGDADGVVIPADAIGRSSPSPRGYSARKARSSKPQGGAGVSSSTPTSKSTTKDGPTGCRARSASPRPTHRSPTATSGPARRGPSRGQVWVYGGVCALG